MGWKVLLVYPEMPPTYWSFRYAMPFIGKRAAFPPLGLLTVAAMLPEDFEVTLVDMNASPLTPEAVSAADLVLTSSMIVQRESLAEVIRLCRSCGTPVVAGGPYPTGCHERIDGVDHFVLDEAEVTLPAFLADFREGRAAPLYSDASKPDLASTPPPRFDLIRMGDYAAMALQFSRGCPHDCEFCDIVELFGHRPRTKPPTRFIAEMDALYATGWRGSLFIVDDNFIGNRRAVKALLREVARWQAERAYPFALFTEATLDLAADEELMALMREAGFNMVFLGIETPVEETLRAVHKAHNLRGDMLEGVRRIQRAGMEVSAGFVLGFDSDPPDIFERQVAFIQEAGIPTAMVGLLTALPNTRLYKRLESEGRIAQDSGGNNTHDFQLSYVPKMDAQVLLSGYKRLLSEIYRPRRYFERCLSLLRNLRVHETTERRIGLTELRALGHSLIRQSFSTYTWPYWTFMVRGALLRPRLMAEIVTMAVKGHHFFKMTRRILEVERFKQKIDRLARAFQERASSLSMPDPQARAAELRAYGDRLAARLAREYRRLHKDFRSYAERSLTNFHTMVDEFIQSAAAQAVPSAGS